jgi:hypothetical protein
VSADDDLTARLRGRVRVNPTYRLKGKTRKIRGGTTKALKLTPKRKPTKRIAGALKQGSKPVSTVNVKLTDVNGNEASEKLKVELKR